MLRQLVAGISTAADCFRGSRPERRKNATGKEVRAQYPSGWKARTLWQKCDKLEKYARIWEGHSDYRHSRATFSSLPVAYPSQNPTYSIRWPGGLNQLRIVRLPARTGGQPIRYQNSCLAEHVAARTCGWHIVLLSQQAGFVLIRMRKAG